MVGEDRSGGKANGEGLEGLTEPGRYTDGDGLTLYVASQGRRYWQLRYRLNDKRRDLSLGAVRTMTLREAREAAQNARALVRDGIDPVVARQRRVASLITFEQAAERVHALDAAGAFIELIVGGISLATAQGTSTPAGPAWLRLTYAAGPTTPATLP